MEALDLKSLNLGHVCRNMCLRVCIYLYLVTCASCFHLSMCYVRLVR